MRKILIITILSLAGLVLEFLIFNSVFKWFRPDFEVILVVFFNLYWGSKYGLLTALIGGIIKDSISLNNFGINIFSLVVSSLAVTVSKKYFYHIGSEASRVPMVWAVAVLNILLQYMLNLIFRSYPFGQVFFYVFVPEILVTGLVAPFVLREVRRIVVRFSF